MLRLLELFFFSLDVIVSFLEDCCGLGRKERENRSLSLVRPYERLETLSLSAAV